MKTKHINPRPGVAVAIADADGRLLLFAPGAWWGDQRRAYGQAESASDRRKEDEAHDGEDAGNDSGGNLPEH